MRYVVYVVYDVPDDGVRYRVSRVLEEFGLERLQKSVFAGILSRNLIEELSLVLDETVGGEEADIRIILAPPSYKDRVIVVRSMYDFSLDREEVVFI